MIINKTMDDDDDDDSIDDDRHVALYIHVIKII
jgi:hypothetical protein